MLAPHRLMDLNYCLINVTSIIIECLLQRSESSLDSLFAFAKQHQNKINELDITQAVSFLFLTGKIEYCSDGDLIKLKRQK